MTNLEIAAKRLADWLEKRVEKIQWVGTITPPDSLEELNRAYWTDQKLSVDTRYTENNLFNDSETQIKFRAWHEWVHFNYQLPFTLEGEVEAAFRHVSELPEDWALERHIVFTEVIGHVTHYCKFGRFVDNRKEFAAELFADGRLSPHFNI